MRRVIISSLLAAVVVGISISSYRARTALPANHVDFVRDVQPILRQRCYSCHGPTKQQNNFRLDIRRDALRGGTIAVIGPGNSDGSRLYQRLIGSEFGRQMPPDTKLSAENVSTIKTWIDQGAEWPDAASGETPPAPPDAGASRLMDALESGTSQSLTTLLASDAASINRRGPGGSTPLMFATLYGDTASMQLLLDAKADPNTRNDAGATALMWVATDLAKAQLLIARGADVNARSNDGRTALVVAAGLPGSLPVVNALLARGATIEPARSGDASALAEAAYTGDEDVFMTLVKHGADLAGATPDVVWNALHHECARCVDALVKAVPADTLSAAMVADAPPDFDARHAGLLLSHGANAKAKDDGDRTMLMLVAASDTASTDVVKALIAHGADVNAVDRRGQTALSLAEQHGHTAIVDTLSQYGAKDASLAMSSIVPSPAASPRAAIARSLTLLQRNDQTFMRKAGCVSCHNNTLTAETIAAARAAGLTVNEAVAKEQRNAISDYLDTWRDRALQGQGIPGDTDTVSYILVGLAAEHHAPDAATDAMARFVRRQQTSEGAWHILAHRPPLESSDIEVTATAMRALQAYAPARQRDEYQAIIARAAAWIASAKPVTTEDRSFQLIGLHCSGASIEAIRAAGRGLIAMQRPDGGWSQIATLGSDAYATGQALVALRESGAIAAGDPAFTRGVRYLMQTQAADGSWLVRTRAIPIQPMFDSGFPYGRDQFISAAGTNWATRALVLSILNASQH